jgi:hypothetical protein
MKILKTFVDSKGVKHRPGGDVPKDWDKSTLEHYKRHGMVGDPPKPRKPVGPKETKPAGPGETKGADAPTDTTAQDNTATESAAAP